MASFTIKPITNLTSRNQVLIANAEIGVFIFWIKMIKLRLHPFVRLIEVVNIIAITIDTGIQL